MTIDLNRLPDAVQAEHLFTVMLLDLAAELPAYVERVSEYIDYVSDEEPEVALIQGVLRDKFSMLSQLTSNYNLHVSKNPTRFDYCNVTCTRKDITLAGSTELRLTQSISSNNHANGTRQVELAPDCLIDTIMYNERLIRLYNYEAIRGPLYEPHRVYCASLITRDAYMYRKEHKNNALLYLGGDLHADDDFESVRLLGGKVTRDGVYASAFTDVWPVMHALDGDPGITERTIEVLDASVKIPQLVKPKRHMYFMAYGDVFGRAGTPLQIEINGNHKTVSDIPWSNDYGLTMTLWIPPLVSYMIAE